MVRFARYAPSWLRFKSVFLNKRFEIVGPSFREPALLDQGRDRSRRSFANRSMNATRSGLPLFCCCCCSKSSNPQDGSSSVAEILRFLDSTTLLTKN